MGCTCGGACSHVVSVNFLTLEQHTIEPKFFGHVQCELNLPYGAFRNHLEKTVVLECLFEFFNLEEEYPFG